ncbi:MAG: carboxypeptidase regulatory-like domain-containing protein, partial [Bacteroidales bacterium]|nr:carboxypeptidase regulatory-like domain-containing protein [Bacteroidales bacterium]
KGKVINNGVDNVEGILFTLAGNIDISDKNGEFDFPYVKTGTHFLFMDNSKSGLNSIAETPGPYKIEILPGQETFFEISLTKSGKITGSIVIEEDENKDKKGFIPVKEEIKNLIIEANNGNEIYRIFTKKDGAFNFEDLRPGQWKVKVYDRGIPKGYKLVTDEYYINLTSGQVENINVIIKKESRRIKFQKKF